MAQQSVAVSPDILVNEVGGEAVLLHLKSERYFGMDAVGTRMWQVLTASPSLQAAYNTLLEEYDVSPKTLQTDFVRWLEQLIELEMIELRDA